MKPLPNEERLTAYALGELPPDEAREIEALLAASPEARQELEEIRGFAEVLTESFRDETLRSHAPSWNDVLAQQAAASTSAPETNDAPEDRLDVPPPAERGPILTPFENPGWRRWIGFGLAAGLCALAAAWWLTSRPNQARIPRMAAQTERPDPVPAPVPAPAPAPASAPIAPTSASIPVDPALTSTSQGPDRGLVQIPESIATAPDRLTLHAPQPSGLTVASANVPPAPQPAAPQPQPQPMPLPEAQLMRRYGLMPAPSPGSAPEAAPSTPSTPTTLALSAQTANPRARSKLSDDPGDRLALVPSPSRPASPESRTLAFRGLSSADSLSASASRPDTWEFRPRLSEAVAPEAADTNPGYVDTPDAAFVSPRTQPLSTFGLDVDTGSYANVRRFLTAGSFPPRAAVRIEEMINYFRYRYPDPSGDAVFGVRADVAPCPWEPNHRVVRIALKARDPVGEPKEANLVFLVDVSGSMQPGERLPLLKQALRALVKRLSPSDRVAIVTYANGSQVRLPSTPGESRDLILEAIDSLEAGGGTNGEGGIRQAYEMARNHFIPGGVNRVLLCTDGDFNIGMSNQESLVELIRQEARSGVFLTTLGVGTDNFKDSLMRRLADSGNGSYHYLDSYEEAQRVLLDQRASTFVVVARDAKAQIEFNPATVAAWRQIGYEKRLLPAEAFNDDSKDAGEVGAGQTVTVLYEIVPAGVQVPGAVDPLKYQASRREETPRTASAHGSELFTLKLRHQRPEGSRSVLQELAVSDNDPKRHPDADFKFALAVASFGMALREPNWHAGRGFELALELARAGQGEDPGGTRAEFLTLVRKARGMPRR